MHWQVSGSLLKKKIGYFELTQIWRNNTLRAQAPKLQPDGKTSPSEFNGLHSNNAQMGFLSVSGQYSTCLFFKHLAQTYGLKEVQLIIGDCNWNSNLSYMDG